MALHFGNSFLLLLTECRFFADFSRPRKFLEPILLSFEEIDTFISCIQEIAVQCRKHCINYALKIVVKLPLTLSPTSPNAIFQSVEKEIKLIKIDNGLAIVLTE